MPTPLEFTAILLAGSISTGDPEMDTYLVEATLEAKYRSESMDEPDLYDNFEREYFTWEVGRVTGINNGK